MAEKQPWEGFTLAVEAGEIEDERTIVLDGLDAYNAHHMGPDQGGRVAVYVRDGSRAIRGGLLGWSYWDALAIHVLWLDNDLRGRGIGTRVLALAEAEAVRRGCTFAHLDTLSFQALGFYEKLGYSRFGTLLGFRDGVERYYLRKNLPAAVTP